MLAASSWVRPALAALTLLAGAAPAIPAPAEPAWQAEWIGPRDRPMAPAAGRGFAGASWIWFAESGSGAVTVNAPQGKRCFRRRFALPAGTRIKAAELLATADDQFVAFVNGREAGRSDGQNDAWGRPRRLNVKGLLREGANVIAIEATNGAGGGAVNAAGLLARLTVEVEDGPAVTITTDGTWKSTDAVPAGWQAPEFDDAAWKPAKVLGPAGMQPWGDVSQARPSTDPMANTWTCFRKTFVLPQKPARAVARIAVDSRYWLWVNGKQVVFEGGLKRGPTPKDTYYDEVDLAPSLSAGRNTVAILAWYWGKPGFSHNSSGQPGLLFELRAGSTVIASDASWRMKIHPAYGSTEPPYPNYRLAESNVHFDARQDLGDWTAPAYDDSGWQAPAAMGRPPAAPWNALVLRPIPLWKDYGLKEYVNQAALPAEGSGKAIACKLPYNAQITPWLKVDAPAGLTIDIRMDDYTGGGEPNVRSEYVTRAGVQEFESLGWMNGHEVRYTIPAGVKILGLKYRETGYNCEFSGAFSCEDETLNKLWEKCRRTLYITMRDNYMDCPDRERAQWWGDAVNELGEAFYALSPSASLLTKKAISNLVLWQRPDKTIFSPVPAGNWSRELPPQMLASVGYYGFWTYYLYSGDKAAMLEAYPHVKDYLAVWKLDADGLVVHRRGEWDWEDWGDNIDARLLDNAWYCLALDSAAGMADLAGEPQEAARYRATRKAVGQAFNRKFWAGTEYRTPGYNGKTDDRGNALAVVAGLVEPARFPATKAVLAREFHASPYMEKYVLEALMLMGEPDAALARMKQRYDRIVASPMTTLPELWAGGTNNHAWSGGPLTILSQYVAGIAPTAPGYATYQVRPQMGSLKSVKATVDSCKGPIQVELSREAGRFRMKLTSPAGTRALVCIPKDGLANPKVTANGKPLPAAGVTPKGQDEHYLLYEVAPGAWEIDARGE